MKKTLLFSSLICAGLISAQSIIPAKALKNFDYEKALLEAKARGLQEVDYAGYVELKHRQWLKENGMAVENENHSGMKIISNLHNLSANNIDFETGDYTGWSAFAGENTLNSNGSLQFIHPMTPGVNDSVFGTFNNNCLNSDTTGRQGLISSAMGNDPLGGFPLSSPMGGNYVARLNRYCMNMEGSILEQAFTVTSGNTYLNYAYAVVLEDGGHMQGEQTYFSAYVLDALGDTIPGALTYMQAANGTTPGFYPSTNPSYTYTYYKPWTPVSIDLSAYIGQTVTVRFIASDCIFGGHSGYAYVDARLDSTAGPSVVWPGDMNYDLTADMNDLFYLGWAYNATGSVRTSATNNWNAEFSSNWNQSGPYGVDFKHADANGDGTVDLNDTTALVQNFGLNHTFKLSNPNIINAVRSMNIVPSSTTINPGQVFYLDIDLGSTGIPADDTLFGISFNVNTPLGLVTSLSSTDFSNSFMGVKNSTMTGLAKDLVASNNMVPVGISRINHSNASGSGNLVRLYFQAGNWSGTVNGTFTVNGVSSVGMAGNYNLISGATATLNFTNGTLGINTLNSQNVSVYPNPAKETLTVSGIKGNNCPYEITNLLGETLISFNMTSSNAQINISSLSIGNYFLRVYSADGIVMKKFVKE